MAYKQSPANVLKGQMTNKAVGLAHGDSMALQTDPKDNEPVVTGKKTSVKKDDLKKLIGRQKQYDANIQSSVQNLAEQDSLRLMAGNKSDQKKAKRIYGHKYESNKKIPFYPNAPQYKEQIENRDRLKKIATNISGSRPSLNK